MFGTFTRNRACQWLARWLSGCAGLVFFTQIAWAQTSVSQKKLPDNYWANIGVPPVTSYRPQDYGGSPLNFSFLQRGDGMMYVGNHACLLEFDGRNWRQVNNTHDFSIKSLAMDAQQRVFAGTIGGFGTLIPNENGDLTYSSLTGLLEESDRIFSDVWDTIANDSGVYFITLRKIFRYHDNQVSVIPASSTFHGAFLVDGKVYVQEGARGLMRIDGSSLVQVLSQDILPDGRIAFMLPYDDGHILIGHQRGQLHLFDGTDLVPLQHQLSEHLGQHTFSKGVLLSSENGIYALGSREGTIILMDKSGRLLYQMNREKGLSGSRINSLFVDSEGALWVATANGVNRVELFSPISYFETSPEHGVQVKSMTTYRNQLYFLKDRFLYRLERSGDTHSIDLSSQDIPGLQQSRLLVIQEFSDVGLKLTSFQDRLLILSRNVLREFRDGQLSVVPIQPEKFITMLASKVEPGILYIGMWDGIKRLRFEAGKWTDLGKIPGVDDPLHNIVELSDGTLWGSTPFTQIFRIDVLGGDRVNTSFRITEYGQEAGVPGGVLKTFLIGDRPIFSSLFGLHEMDAGSNTLVDSSLPAFFPDFHPVRYTQLVEDDQRNIWVSMINESRCLVGVAEYVDEDKWEFDATPFKRFAGRRPSEDWIQYIEQSGVTWYSGSYELLRYDARVGKSYDKPFYSRVRRVVINNDSLLYGGISEDKEPGSQGYIELEHSTSALRFECAALSFDAPEANRFQFLLDGYDVDWSPWTSEYWKDYTGLPEGDYTFRVRSQNVYGTLGGEDQFAFSVLPPWYRTMWAQLLYLLFAVGVVAAIVQWRVHRLQKRTEELEEMVASRTVTIREQAEKLKELDTVKSRFFANISHEFRTPLTLILGPLEDRLAATEKEQDRSEFGMMRKSARRLLQLINQLLDLSRLESGRLILQAERGDFQAFLRGLVMSFASLAEQKGVRLQYDDQVAAGKLDDFYFDRDKFEKIIVNLVSNACKFTPAGGTVKITVSIGTADQLYITVKDTGPGIAEKDLPHIFDRFYQADSTHGAVYGGSGIGLALTKELVTLHHGRISVNSKPGEGTAFSLEFPIGKEHFKEGEFSDEITVHESSEEPMLYSMDADRNEDAPEPGASETAASSDDADIVLVVDDHPDVRRYVVDQLKDRFTIVEADNGRSGLEKASETVPDLIISDVMMPEMDGYEFCKELKTNEKTSHIPVILLTAKAGEDDKLEGLETGADAYLVKPFNARELLTRVQKLIESRRKMREIFRREGMLKPRERQFTSVEETFLQKLMDAIEAHLADEDFGVEELSKKLFMSRRQLQRKIRALADQTPRELINSIRLERARQMLAQRAGTVSDVAYAVGFTNLSYFSKRYREEFGVSPSEALKE